MKSINRLIVTGLGTGRGPIAPGTWGSGAVAVIFCAAAWLSGGSAWVLGATMLAIAVGASAACVALGGQAEREFGCKDPGPCTIDEWAGQAITYLLLPSFAQGWGWLTVAAVGFVAFRVFDIIKPPPARAMEKLPAGWGILLDDVVAGIYANIVCQLLLRLWLLPGG